MKIILAVIITFFLTSTLGIFLGYRYGEDIKVRNTASDLLILSQFREAAEKRQHEIIIKYANALIESTYPKLEERAPYAFTPMAKEAVSDMLSKKDDLLPK